MQNLRYCMKPFDDDTSNMGIYLQIIENPIVWSQKKIENLQNYFKRTLFKEVCKICCKTITKSISISLCIIVKTKEYRARKSLAEDWTVDSLCKGMAVDLKQSFL